MSTELSFLSKRYFFNRGMVKLLTQDFTPGDWGRRPTGGGNDAHWILGHLAATRRFLLAAFGRPVPDEPWVARFGRGAEPADNAEYPAPELLFADLHARGKELTALFESLTPEEASRPYEGRLPDGSETVLDAAGFFLFHETYHIGQISLLRILGGKSGIA